MLIEVKAKDENGDLLFEGKINKRETAFLIQYAINDLMAAGVQFHLERPDEDPEDDPQLRFDFPPIGGMGH